MRGRDHRQTRPSNPSYQPVPASYSNRGKASRSRQCPRSSSYTRRQRSLKKRGRGRRGSGSRRWLGRNLKGSRSSLRLTRITRYPKFLLLRSCRLGRRRKRSRSMFRKLRRRNVRWCPLTLLNTLKLSRQRYLQEVTSSSTRKLKKLPKTSP